MSPHSGAFYLAAPKSGTKVKWKHKNSSLTKSNSQEENVWSFLPSQRSSMETSSNIMCQTAGVKVNKQSFHTVHWLKFEKQSCDRKTCEVTRCPKYFERKQKIVEFR